MTKKDDSKLKTAVSGIVVVPYRTDSLLSRFIPEQAFFNDGMFHALLISPRSILELLSYLVRSFWKKNQLPLLRRASTEEFKDLFQILRDNARLKVSYLVLMVLSTVLATLGLFADSAPVVIVIIFSIPLGFGFGHMVEEHNVVRRLDGWQTEEVTLRDVRVRTVRPLSLSVTLVSRQPLDPDELDGVKARIEERLNRTVQLEINTALER